MCYSAKDSLIAYIIGFTSNIYLFYNSKNNDEKVISLTFLFVSHMQLFDYFFWKNKECNKNNKLSTKLAILFNHLQPVVLFLLLKYFKYDMNMYTSIIFYIYVIIGSIYTIKNWPKIDCNEEEINCCSLPLEKKDNKTIIYWKWNNNKYNEIMYSVYGLSILFSGLNLIKFKYEFILSIIFTNLISHKIPNLNRTTGRTWCYLSALITFFFLIATRIFKYKN